MSPKTKINKRKGNVVKSIIFENVSSYRINFIDFHSQSDAGYKYIYDYKNHLTKVCIFKIIAI